MTLAYTRKNYSYHENLADAMIMLNNVQLLTPENKSLLLRHSNYTTVASTFILLHHAGLLTADIKNKIIRIHAHHELGQHLNILNTLSSADILNSDNLNAIFNPVDGIGDIGKFQPLNNLPVQLLTQEVFNHICGLTSFRQVDAYVVELRAQLRRDRPMKKSSINTSQSTHTSSVHVSVSNSVKNLRNIYLSVTHKANLDLALEDFSTWIANLPENPRNHQIKQGYEKLINSIYTDEVSQTTLRELLSLAWIAIHDNSRRLGTLDDAKKMLADGIWETYVEYSLDQDGNYSVHRIDIAACISGSFNKIVEKLDGVHPAVKIIFLTLRTATLKFRQLVLEQLNAYLVVFRTNNTLLAFNDLLVKLKEEGIEPLWSELEPKLSQSMFDEFGSLFKGTEDSSFKQLIDSGIYVDISSLLNKFEQPIDTPKISNIDPVNSSDANDGMVSNATILKNSEMQKDELSQSLEQDKSVVINDIDDQLVTDENTELTETISDFDNHNVGVQEIPVLHEVSAIEEKKESNNDITIEDEKSEQLKPCLVSKLATDNLITDKAVNNNSSAGRSSLETLKATINANIDNYINSRAVLNRHSFSLHCFNFRNLSLTEAKVKLALQLKKELKPIASVESLKSSLEHFKRENMRVEAANKKTYRFFTSSSFEKCLDKNLNTLKINYK